MKTLKRNYLAAALLSLGLFSSSQAFAQDTTLPAKPEARNEAAESVQPELDAEATGQAAERRKKVTADAIAAVNESKNALKLLDDKKTEETLAALEQVTGKLELILAREPTLALAPVDVEIVAYDLLADLDTIRAVIKEAEDYLEDGEIQKARPLVANLASEIQIRTTNIPLATYPAAIKAVAPLIDAGKVGEAKVALQAALNTLVVTTDEVIPLPIERAESLLKKAEALAENKERKNKDNETLASQLSEARNQIKMAELLGYGNKKAFKPIYEQIDQIEEKASNNGSGRGWFDKIKQQLSELI